MRKILCAAMVLVMLFTVTVIPVSAEEEVKVILNGEELEFDVPAQLIDGRTMVPLRKIFETLGAVVMWDDDTQTVFAKKDETIIAMQIDNSMITVNNEKITLDVPPMLLNNRTLVPLRAVAESLDCAVDWDEANWTVIIAK